MLLADVVSKIKLVGIGLSGDANDDTGQFIFKNGRISASNGIFGVWANMDIGVETALPGSKLQSIISSFNGNDVEFTNVGDSVRFASGRSKATLRKLAITGRVMPELEGVAFDWHESWTKALDRCSWSVSDDQQRPDLAGVTMHAVEGSMTFYSTIGSGITRCCVPGDVDPGLVGSSVIIPAKYLYAMQKIIGGSRPCVALQFSDNIIHSQFGDGDAAIHLYGNFAFNARPDRYDTAIQGILNGLEWQTKPDGLDAALDRVDAAGGSDALTEISTSNGQMTLTTKDDFGQIEDRELAFDGENDPICVRAAMLRRAAAVSDQMAINRSCVGLRCGDIFTYVQATVSPSTPTQVDVSR